MSPQSIAWLGLGLAVIAGLGNLVGAYLTVVRKDHSPRFLLSLIATSAGFILPWAILELIPRIVTHEPSFVGFVLAGYLGIYLLENLFASSAHGRGEAHHSHALAATLSHHEPLVSIAAGWAALSGLLVHAFFDGAGMMAGFQVTQRTGLLMFVAVMVHKIPEGTSLSSILLAARQGRRRVLQAVSLIALATVLGAVGALWLGALDARISYVILALSAGTFLFVGASNLIPATQKGEYRSTAAFVLLGTIVYYAAAALLTLGGWHE